MGRKAFNWHKSAMLPVLLASVSICLCSVLLSPCSFASDSSSAVQLTGDALRVDLEKRSIRAEGNVILKYKDITILCHLLEMDAISGELAASGDVEFHDGEDVARGEILTYDYNFGIFNFLLKTIGLSPVEWLSSTDWALLSVVLTDIWQWTPFVFLVILASLQSIPLEIYESAQVEGASYVQSLRYITLPLLRPALALVLLLRTIDTFRVFDKMYVLTGGGPGNATETITYYIYRYGFRYFQTGYAAAASIIMVIMVLILSIPYIKQVIGTADFQRNAN
jgi:hypothetical protein